MRNVVNQNGEASASLLFDTHSVTIVSEQQTSQARISLDMNEDSISNLLDPSSAPSPNYIDQRRAEGHYRSISPLLGVVLVMVAACSVLCGQIRRDTLSRRTMLNVGAAMAAIAMLVSSRSLATSMPSAIALIYASLLVPALILFFMLVMPSLRMRAADKATAGITV